MSAPDDTTPLILTLEVAWHTIREHHPDLPGAAFTIAPTDRDRWEHRGDVVAVAVGRAAVRRGAEGILNALLRAAARALAHERGVRVTSRRGRYFNDRFRKIGEEVGLTFGAADPGYGWVTSTPAPTTIDRYADTLAVLAAAAPAKLPPVPRRPRKGQRAAACECPRMIRVARTVLERGPIVCTVCGQPFALADEPRG
jgi:hypothetical protein